MNKFIFVAAYLATAFMDLFGFLIVPIVSIWIGLMAGEVFRLPFAGTARKFWQKWMIAWPLRKIWILTIRVGAKIIGGAWRGFIIVMKRLGEAAWRGAKIIGTALWSRLRGGTP